MQIYPVHKTGGWTFEKQCYIPLPCHVMTCITMCKVHQVFTMLTISIVLHVLTSVSLENMLQCSQMCFIFVQDITDMLCRISMWIMVLQLFCKAKDKQHLKKQSLFVQLRMLPHTIR